MGIVADGDGAQTLRQAVGRQVRECSALLEAVQSATMSCAGSSAPPTKTLRCLSVSSFLLLLDGSGIGADGRGGFSA